MLIAFFDDVQQVKDGGVVIEVVALVVLIGGHQVRVELFGARVVIKEAYLNTPANFADKTSTWQRDVLLTAT